MVGFQITTVSGTSPRSEYRTNPLFRSRKQLKEKTYIIFIVIISFTSLWLEDHRRTVKNYSQPRAVAVIWIWSWAEMVHKNWTKLQNDRRLDGRTGRLSRSAWSEPALTFSVKSRFEFDYLSGKYKSAQKIGPIRGHKIQPWWLGSLRRQFSKFCTFCEHWVESRLGYNYGCTRCLYPLDSDMIPRRGYQR